jgi:hypothetical protein
LSNKLIVDGWKHQRGRSSKCIRPFQRITIQYFTSLLSTKGGDVEIHLASMIEIDRTILKQFHDVIMSRCHDVPMSRCHDVTMSRCHDIGQIRNVKTFRLILINSYERRIIDRAAQIVHSTIWFFKTNNSRNSNE